MSALVLRYAATCILGTALLVLGNGNSSSPALAAMQLAPISRPALFDPGLGSEAARRTSFRLHAAALNNRPTDATRLLDRGIPVDVPASQGTTPLMVAVAFGNLEVATVLIERGADPNAHDAVHGATPLHFAAMAGHRALVALLLANGARVDIRDTRGETPLHYAAFYNRADMVGLLARTGADLNLANNEGLSPFNLASRHGRRVAAAALSAAGAREGGLIEAINAGDLIRVRTLIAEGADVNAAGLRGTPLNFAATKGQIAIADALLEARANLEAPGDASGLRPLHLAALVNDAPMAAFLVKRGADTEARDAEGRTPLMVAEAFGSWAVAEFLLNRGGDLRAFDVTSR